MIDIVDDATSMLLDVTYTYGRTTKDEKRQASRSRIASHYGWD